MSNTKDWIHSKFSFAFTKIILSKKIQHNKKWISPYFINVT